MKVYRYEENPLVIPEDVKPHIEGFEVIGAFNAGIATYNGEIIMLLRVAERPISNDPTIVKVPIFNLSTKTIEVKEFNLNDERYNFEDSRYFSKVGESKWEYLTSISHLRIARSKDGRNFTIEDKPFIFPSNRHEIYGIEDARITEIDEKYYIYFSVVSEAGVGEALVVTVDFRNFTHLGNIFAPENKDVLIFPEKINGKYYALHRPVPHSNGNPEIWIAESDNLRYWGNHRHLIGLRDGMWDSARIGGGAVPIKTDKGWLELYHGANKDHYYCMGAVLLDLEDPSKIIARSDRPILMPETSYEKEGFFGGVVFSCGAILDGDIIKMYYGVADTSMACCELSLSEVLESLTYQ